MPQLRSGSLAPSCRLILLPSIPSPYPSTTSRTSKAAGNVPATAICARMVTGFVWLLGRLRNLGKGYEAAYLVGSHYHRHVTDDSNPRHLRGLGRFVFWLCFYKAGRPQGNNQPYLERAIKMIPPQQTQSSLETSEQLADARPLLNRWSMPPLRSSIDWLEYQADVTRLHERFLKLEEKLAQL